MAHDPTHAAPPRERIDIHEYAELRQWASRLDTTAEQIRQAVQAVGDRAADVEMHLKGTRATTNADREARAEDILLASRPG